MRGFGLVLAGVILLGARSGKLNAGVPVAQTGSQTGTPAGSPAVGLPGTGHAAGEDTGSPQLAERQEKARNTDRQKRLVADTEKLLILATDLKQEVGKTNKEVMSVDVIKKAEEIEKLARSVKDRMKG
ncbi:MAG: hypothetical protein M3Y50_00695 [Acidobacteriota bacterium]|nr:hypothetical protein [Acidobacteriota bacterium]